MTAADQPDSDSTPNDGQGDDAATVAVSAQPTDLALTIAASDATPAVGDDVTFTVTLDNQSGTAASGVDVSALLPAGLQFVSSDPSQGTYDAANGAWGVGSLGPNGQATLRVTATVTEVGPQSVTAQVAAQDQPDADSAPNNDDPTEDDQATATVTGQPTDLALAVAASDTAPAFGDPVTFTVTVDNQSQTRAAGVRVAAPLPAGYTFVSSTRGGQPTTPAPAGGPWARSPLAAPARWRSSPQSGRSPRPCSAPRSRPRARPTPTRRPATGSRGRTTRPRSPSRPLGSTCRLWPRSTTRPRHWGVT